MGVIFKNLFFGNTGFHGFRFQLPGFLTFLNTRPDIVREAYKQAVALGIWKNFGNNAYRRRLHQNKVTTKTSVDHD